MSTNRINTRDFVLLLLMIALVGMVACGGNEQETVATPAETDALPTDAPVVAPTDPPAVLPTDEPPTAEPSTAEPTPEPPTAEPEPVFAVGECGNAYYPVVEGRVMVYTTNAADLGAVSFTSTTTNVTESSFTLSTDVGEGNVFATDWQCSSEGLLSPEFSQMPGNMAGLTIEFVEATGVTIPTEDMFRVGESWPTHYVANATMPIDDTTSMTMIQTIDMINTVTGIESVSVPAGDYPEAVVIDTVSTISVSMSDGQQSVPGMTIEMNYKGWYVEGVGMVKQEITDFLGDSGEGSNITELVEIR